jgi:hypothetical protein
MAERKFAALAELRRRPAQADPPADPPAELPRGHTAPPDAAVPPVPVPPALAPPPAPVLAPALEQGRGRGRPPGKRSDPDWAPRTILMRSKTHRRVSILLLEREIGPDLSELVDQLLTDWISKQS